MEETGRVIDVKGDRVVVELERKSGQGCKGCGLCARGAEGGYFLEAFNSANAGRGDTVVIRLADSTLLRGILLLYGLPLAGFIFGVVAAYCVQNAYLKAVLFLSIFLASCHYGFKKANLTAVGDGSSVVRKM